MEARLQNKFEFTWQLPSVVPKSVKKQSLRIYLLNQVVRLPAAPLYKSILNYYWQRLNA